MAEVESAPKVPRVPKTWQERSAKTKVSANTIRNDTLSAQKVLFLIDASGWWAEIDVQSDFEYKEPLKKWLEEEIEVKYPLQEEPEDEDAATQQRSHDKWSRSMATR